MGEGKPTTPRERAEQTTLAELAMLLKNSRATLEVKPFGKGKGHRASIRIGGENYATATGRNAVQALLGCLTEAFELTEQAELQAMERVLEDCVRAGYMERVS